MDYYQQFKEKRYFLLWLVIGIIVAGALIFAADWEANRQEKLRVAFAFEQLSDLAQTSRIIIADRLREYDNSLLVLRQAYIDDPENFSHILQILRSGSLADLDLLVVLVDREGLLSYTDTPNVNPGMYLGDRAYFRFFADGGEDSLYIDEPVFGRVTRRYTLPLVRPVIGRQGEFLGVVALSVLQTKLGDFSKNIELSSDTTVTVINNGGAVVARSRNLEAVQGTKIPRDRLAFLLAHDAGAIFEKTRSDKKAHLIAYQHIRYQGAPLIVFVDVSADELLSMVAKQRQVLLAGAIFLSLVIIALLFVNQRRRQVSAKLFEAQRLNLLAETDRRFRTIIHASLDGFWIVDTQGRLQEVNQAYCQMSGYSRQELLTMRIADLEVLESADEVTVHVRQVMDRGKERFETRHRRKDGSTFDVEVSAQYRPDQGGQLVIFLRDTTERKKAMEELAKSRADFLAMFNSIPAGLVFADRERRILMVNPGFSKMWGYTAAEVIGRTTEMLYPSREDYLAAGRLHYNLDGQVAEVSFEITYRRKDGTLFPAESIGCQVRDDHGEVIGFFAVNRDITARRLAEEEKDRLQAQLRQAIKMQAVGTMAGGIAHEFNNLLGIIIGYTEIAQDELPEDSYAKSKLDQVMKASFRVKDLVKQILTFSRQAQQKKMPVNLSPLIRESINLISPTLPSSVEIKKNIDSKCGCSIVDPTEIQQITINLGSNAVWAMKEKGTIKIGLHQVLLDNQMAARLNLKERRYIEFLFADNGRGMDKETQKRIFDPFFTQKEVGVGTGMGLSIVYAIMESYGGAITVESEVGKGAAFRLYFPVTDEPGVKIIRSGEEVPKGTERILFIDDEEMYAKMGKEMLSHLGYDVDLKMSSTEALAAMKATPGDYDLVITDQIMPELSGEELVREIRSVKPNIPVILCTGYSSQMDSQKAASMGINAFANKPISKMDMAKLIRKVLDEK